ncbi:MAG: hypothetical protein IAF02_08870 [Anaerolineae bacterium]|nr:hypothetical protein [Anaerolineae bacterium]
MSRRIITFIFIVGLAATFLLYPQAKSHEVQGMPNFTVITRTSTPNPVPPTATRPNDGGGSKATATPQATAVPPTPTLIQVTLAATQAGGFMPTAVSCGFPPTVQAQNSTFVRTGPGADYDIVGQLVYLETRPIIGRAIDSEWWVIQYTNEQIAWVANAVVTVQGNTNGVPLVGAPLINGVTATPGPLWQPTPNPACPTMTPSATPTATETASATETPLPAETAGDGEPTITATSVLPTAETILADAAAAAPQPTAEPLAPPSAVSALPCASAIIGLAVLGFITFRRIF